VPAPRTTDKPLSPRQSAAARLLSVGWLTDRKVADLVRVRRETIWAWRQQPRFREKVDGLAREFDAYTRRLARAGLEPALTRLEQLVQSPDSRTAFAAMDLVLRLNGRLP